MVLNLVVLSAFIWSYAKEGDITWQADKDGQGKYVYGENKPAPKPEVIPEPAPAPKPEVKPTPAPARSQK